MTTWRSGLPFTVCGSGSLPENTANIRKVLPEWCEKYGLRVVNDAGAGDMKWRLGMAWAVVYRPFDSHPIDASVTRIDITSETLPVCDLVLCRLVLNHLGINHAKQAMARFPQSGKYLAATQYNVEMPKGKYDLRQWFGSPLESVADGSGDGCSLALWRLPMGIADVPG